MKCSSCGSEWETDSKLGKGIKTCPFCGADLFIRANKTKIHNLSDCFSLVIDEFGVEILSAKKKFYSALTDVIKGNLPNDEKTLRLLKTLCDFDVFHNFPTLDKKDYKEEIVKKITELKEDYGFDTSKITGIFTDFLIALGVSKTEVNKLFPDNKGAKYNQDVIKQATPHFKTIKTETKNSLESANSAENPTKTDSIMSEDLKQIETNAVETVETIETAFQNVRANAKSNTITSSYLYTKADTQYSSSDGHAWWYYVLLFFIPLGPLWLIWIALQTKIGKRIILSFLGIAVVAVGGYFLISSLDNSASKVYVIGSAEDFSKLGKYNKATFEISNDIDLNGQEISGFGEFKGIINGNNHRIYNFTLKRDKEGGLFTTIQENAEINNIIFENFNFEVNDKTGVLCAYNYGSISKCGFKNGTIKGDDSVGAVGGQNFGNISECFVKNVKIQGLATGTYIYLGGIIGKSFRIISNCYTQVTIEVSSTSGANITAGGLIGEHKGTINNSYSICSITSYSSVSNCTFGGVCGINYNDNGKVNNCFFKSDDSSLTIGYSYGGFLSTKQYNNCYSYQKQLETYGSDEEVLNNTYGSRTWILNTLNWDLGKWVVNVKAFPTLYWEIL